MPLDFPASPSVGQRFTGAGAAWMWDGTKWGASGINGGGPLAIRVFTSSQSYVPSPGMATAIVECVGGGGAGASTTGAGGVTIGLPGGGAGGYSRRFLTAAQIGASQAITIGAGGVGASNAVGTSGTATSFGTLCIANGGAGGINSDYSGALGGVTAGAVGDVVAAGEPGGGGSYAGTSTGDAMSGGQGGSGPWGGGGVATWVSGNQTIAGRNGTSYGAGGSGAGGSNWGAAMQPGGNGSAGVCIVTEFGPSTNIGIATTPNIKSFIANGTYTPSPGLISAIVEVWGGASGAGNAVTHYGGSGGGYARKVYWAAGLTSPVAITIGAGGAESGTTPGAGGTTTFAAPVPVSASGGVYASSGGTGSGGDINLTGQRGTNGISGGTYGVPGNAPFMSGAGLAGNTALPGIANTGCGNASASGFPGASGFCLITEFIAAGVTTSTTLNRRVFTSTQSYVPSAGLMAADVECIGAGGAGGAANGFSAYTTWAGGGGSGGYSKRALTAAQIGASQTITVGAGGTCTGLNDGTAGADSSFGALCIAKGGGGGKKIDANAGSSASNSGQGGAAGVVTGAVGDVVAAGAPGGNGGWGVQTIGLGGHGGVSALGGAGIATAPYTGISLPATGGGAATNYGSGGAGGTTTNYNAPGSPVLGGAGSAGVVIVTEYLAGVGTPAGGVTTTPTTPIVLTSGSGTFTTPQGTVALDVQLVGGGGGGGGGAAGVASAGGNTTFGSLTAGGALTSAAFVGGLGGSASGGDVNIVGSGGGSGSWGQAGVAAGPGGLGGSSPFGGGGAAGYGVAGGAAAVNSGSGGGGGGVTGNTVVGGPGGASGGYVRKLILNPAASYPWAVGAGGAGAGGGANGYNGGNGAAGIIVVTPYIAAASTSPVIQVQPGGLVQIARFDISTPVASVDFKTGIDATFDEYELHMYGINPATVGNFGFRISQDGGATFKAGASDYSTQSAVVSNPSGAFSSASYHMALLGNLGNVASQPSHGTVRFWLPWKAGIQRSFAHHMATIAAQFSGSIGTFNYVTDTNPFNAVRLLSEGGNINAGTFILYGVKK